jgi:hypothetical protein
MLDVCYADKQFHSIKQELDQDLQNELNLLQSEARENEAPLVTCWFCEGIHLFLQEQGSMHQCFSWFGGESLYDKMRERSCIRTRNLK